MDKVEILSDEKGYGLSPLDVISKVEGDILTEKRVQAERKVRAFMNQGHQLFENLSKSRKALEDAEKAYQKWQGKSEQFLKGNWDVVEQKKEAKESFVSEQ